MTQPIKTQPTKISFEDVLNEPKTELLPRSYSDMMEKVEQIFKEIEEEALQRDFDVEGEDIFYYKQKGLPKKIPE